MRILAFVFEPAVIRKILAHLDRSLSLAGFRSRWMKG